MNSVLVEQVSNRIFIDPRIFSAYSHYLNLVIQYINIRLKAYQCFLFGMSEYLEKNTTKMRCLRSRSIFASVRTVRRFQT